MTRRSAESSAPPPSAAGSYERADVSVVLPVFNERANLEPLMAELKAVLFRERFEVILVDDGSVDGSGEVIASLVAAGGPYRVIKQGRNRGQSLALMAGFDAARGGIVATLDADGQNDPADLPALLALLRENDGLAAVVGYRADRSDSHWKRLQSVVANRARDLITGDRVRDTGCSLRVVRRRWLTGLERFDGMHRFIPTLIRGQGGIVVEVPVRHRPRLSGRSNYGMWNRIGQGFRDAIRVRRLLRRQNGKSPPLVIDAKKET